MMGVPTGSNMEIRQHWLVGARRQPSPNQSDRPPGEVASLLVIHNISLPPGEFGGPWIDDLFCNRLDCSRHPFFDEIRNLRVSSHLLIRRDGELVQYVPFDKKAWHAGRSCFQEREECNDFSIGVELEGSDHTPFTGRQYQMLDKVARALLQAYPAITLERIVGHSDIAPGRKTDPGPHFDWAAFRHRLRRASRAGQAY